MNTLREWRAAHGLSLEEVSALSGMSVSELSRVERGLRSVAPLRRVELARRLGARLRELFPPDAESLDDGAEKPAVVNA